MTIAARDGGNPSLVSQNIQVIINVIRNDNPPVFINEPYTVNIASSQVAGAFVIQVTATDADISVRATAEKSSYSNFFFFLNLLAIHE